MKIRILIEMAISAFWGFLIFAACTKNSPEVPIVNLGSVTDITETTAFSTGEILDIGSSNIIECGICWSTSPRPTIEGDKLSYSYTHNNFSASISGLEPNITYYIRAYAINSEGIGYSKESVFTTLIPLHNIWTAKKPMSAPGRYDAVGFAINDKLYLGLGQISDGTRVYDFWEYDPQTDNWTKKADYPGVGSYSATSFVINGKGYVCLGLNNSDTNGNDLWEYSPVDDTWLRKADFPGTGRYGAVSFVIDGTAFVGTGSYGNGYDYLSDMWMYDPSANTWTKKADFAGDKRSHAVSFSTGNWGYLGTGLSSSVTPQKDLWKYDKTLDFWTRVSDFPSHERWGVTSMIFNDKVYLGFGRDILYDYNDFYGYDAIADSWILSVPLKYEVTARSNPVSYVMDNLGYMATGYVQNGILLNDLWTFVP